MKRQNFIKRNSSAVLTVLSLAGMISTVYLSVKATPKAIRLIQKDSLETHGDKTSYTIKEAVKSSWKCYIPAIAVGTGTILCICGIHVLSTKNQASLISAYGLLDKSFKHYKKAAISVFGEDADDKINAEIASEMFIHAYGNGMVYNPHLDNSEKVLFYDMYSHRYFESTLAAVINAQYHFNRNLALKGSGCINELYNFLGIEQLDGLDDIGWDIVQMSEYGYNWLDFDNENVDLPDGMTCYIIKACIDPISADELYEY